MNIEVLPEKPIKVQIEFGGYVSAATVAEVFKVHPQTVRGWGQRGWVNCRIYGGLTYILWADCERLLRDGTPSEKKYNRWKGLGKGAAKVLAERASAKSA